MAVNDNSPPITALDLDNDEFEIAFDLLCSTCGYNLRSQRMGKACPECGSAVRRSAMGDELRFANIQWLYKVRIGLLTLAAVSMATFIFRIARIFGLDEYPVWAFPFAERVMMALAWLGLIVMDVVALCLIVSAEPGREQGMRMHYFVRVGALVGGALFASSVAIESFEFMPFGTQSMLYAYVALRFPGFIIWSASSIILLLIMRRLALRGRANALAAAMAVLLIFDVLESMLNGVYYIAIILMIEDSMSPPPNWRLYNFYEMIESVETCFFWFPRLFWMTVLLTLFFKLKGAHNAARQLTAMECDSACDGET